LAIFVLVVAIEYFVRIGWRGTIRRSTTFSTTTGAITPSLAHRLAGCLSLLIVQLSIAIGIEFLNHPGAHFAVSPGALLVLCRCLPHGKQRYC
jgi:hypothetical protein